MKTKRQYHTPLSKISTKATGRRGDAGDTIIEIMLVLAIVGFVIASAIAAVNVSTRQIRQSQERSEALKVTEQQVEQLYGVPADIIEQVTENTSADPADDIFCITDDPNNRLSIFSDVPPANYWEDDLTQYPAECIVGTGERYHIHIIHDADPADPTKPEGTFLFRVRWERLGGGVDEVQIIYRRNAFVYQGTPGVATPGFPPPGTSPGPSPGPGPGAPDEFDTDRCTQMSLLYPNFFSAPRIGPSRIALLDYPGSAESGKNARVRGPLALSNILDSGSFLSPGSYTIELVTGDPHGWYYNSDGDLVNHGRQLNETVYIELYDNLAAAEEARELARNSEESTNYLYRSSPTINVPGDWPENINEPATWPDYDGPEEWFEQITVFNGQSITGTARYMNIIHGGNLAATTSSTWESVVFDCIAFY